MNNSYLETNQLLSGHTCIVTGAGGGVGQGIALALAEAGANVVVAARRAETGEPTAQEIIKKGHSATFIKCDVSNQKDIENTIKETVKIYGGINCFIHNALSSAGKAFQYLETLEDTWKSLNSTAIKASYFSAQAAYPELKKTKGSLILLSSSAGVEGSESLPIYGAAKAAQRGIAKSLAKEWGPQVRVNLVNPVAMTPAMEKAYKLNPDLKDKLENRTPLGHIGNPETDIGKAVVFLASPLASFITGQTLTIDGGNFMGL